MADFIGLASCVFVFLPDCCPIDLRFLLFFTPPTGNSLSMISGCELLTCTSDSADPATAPTASILCPFFGSGLSFLFFGTTPFTPSTSVDPTALSPDWSRIPFGLPLFLVGPFVDACLAVCCCDSSSNAGVRLVARCLFESSIAGAFLVDRWFDGSGCGVLRDRPDF